MKKKPCKRCNTPQLVKRGGLASHNCPHGNRLCETIAAGRLGCRICDRARNERKRNEKPVSP